MELFGEKFIHILNSLHILSAFTLIVALIMGGIFLFAVGEQNWKHIRIATGAAAVSYLVTFLFGWAIYPVWRVDVRAKIFDKTLPVGTGFFEIKEHLAALGAFAALVVLFLVLTNLAKAPATRKVFFSGAFALMALFSIASMALAFAFSRLY